MGTLTDARRTLFEAAFTDGYRFTEQYADTGPTEIVFTVHTSAYPVRTRGGQLEIGGCLFPGNRTLPQGEYPVQCATGALAKAPEAGRNALARVVFADAPPVKWEPLLGQIRVTSQAVESDAPTEEWVRTDALRVDIGSVAFAEPGFGETLEQLAHQHGADDLEQLQELAREGVVPLAVLESTPVLQTSEVAGKRSVAMQSGLGDGTYVVYGGYAADGTITRLVVDFDLFG